MLESLCIDILELVSCEVKSSVWVHPLLALARLPLELVTRNSCEV